MTDNDTTDNDTTAEAMAGLKLAADIMGCEVRTPAPGTVTIWSTSAMTALALHALASAALHTGELCHAGDRIVFMASLPHPLTLDELDLRSTAGRR